MRRILTLVFMVWVCTRSDLLLGRSVQFRFDALRATSKNYVFSTGFAVSRSNQIGIQLERYFEGQNSLFVAETGYFITHNYESDPYLSGILNLVTHISIGYFDQFRIKSNVTTAISSSETSALRSDIALGYDTNVFRRYKFRLLAGYSFWKFNGEREYTLFGTTEKYDIFPGSPPIYLEGALIVVF